jgi:ribonuclease HIII
MKSLNEMLAWGHARVIENLLGKRYQMNPPPVKAISDQFAASKNVIEKALMAQGKELPLVQRHKAEEDIAVAAASILARDEFVKGLAKLEKQFEMKLPKGAIGGGGRGGEKICGRTRRGRTGENFQAAFPHGAACARFA